MSNYRALRLWESSDNYMGEDYGDHYVLRAKTRDSDILDKSNYQAVLNYLTENKITQYEEVKFNHWACGWVLALLIHKDTDPNILEGLDELLDCEGLVDEDLYCEMRAQYAEEFWEDNIKDDEELLELVENRLCGRYACDKGAFSQEDLGKVLRLLYEEACCYYGEEEAFLDDTNIDKMWEGIKTELGQLLGIDTETHQLSFA